jgi:hypothetical protein
MEDDTMSPSDPEKVVVVLLTAAYCGAIMLANLTDFPSA